MAHYLDFNPKPLTTTCFASRPDDSHRLRVMTFAPTS